MKLIIANWKMNPKSEQEAIALAMAEDFAGAVICPPFPFLKSVGAVLKNAKLGAQDAGVASAGAYTGSVSPDELKSLGVKYVIVGHSERRKMGETDELIAQKVKAVVSAGLIPILCVGESRAEHDAGKAEEVVKRQLEIGLSLVPSPYTLIPMIAYEPVWAISTEPGAIPDTPENAARMAQCIRGLVPRPYTLIPTILYGGSVTASNANGFLARFEIDGALVGGASLRPDEFRAIIKASSQIG